MTTIKEWSDRGQHLRQMAQRLENKAREIKAEAEHLIETAVACDVEAARILFETTK